MKACECKGMLPVALLQTSDIMQVGNRQAVLESKFWISIEHWKSGFVFAYKCI